VLKRHETPVGRQESGVSDSIEVIDGIGQHLAAFRELAAEYGHSIADVAACSLEHQGFDQELRDLPGRYDRGRGGCMFIATVDGQPAGCIALRALPEVGPGVCEMKRMYVRPAHRGLKIGRLLAERLIDEARAMGYSVMKLDTDTAPKFAAAIALYRSLGFVECARYNADPDPKTLWFEKRL
jgi:putative acetyltransferase